MLLLLQTGYYVTRAVSTCGQLAWLRILESDHEVRAPKASDSTPKKRSPIHTGHTNMNGKPNDSKQQQTGIQLNKKYATGFVGTDLHFHYGISSQWTSTSTILIQFTTSQPVYVTRQTVILSSHVCLGTIHTCRVQHKWFQIPVSTCALHVSLQSKAAPLPPCRQ
jgi:hypothetical protein